MTTSQPYQLLLIEDDLPLAELIAHYLSKHNIEVSLALNAESAKIITRGRSFDIIVCDIMLPDGNGFNLIKELLKKQSAPVIFLTALSDDDSHIKGLEVGAADYIAKPVSPSVLLAHIKANLRKVQTLSSTTTLQLGIFEFNSRTKSLLRDNVKIEITNQEFDILWLFASQLHAPLERDYLFKKIVGREYDGKDRAMDLKISRLRKKLAQLGLNELSIESIRNQGYVFNVKN